MRVQHPGASTTSSKSVTTSLAKFKIDPWCTKFTVLGRSSSDEAMLKANDTVRKMFAYPHDILKALMADGVKLVVLGRGEKLSDLREFKTFKDVKGFDALSRTVDYTPETKLLVVGEENVIANPRDPNAGDTQVIRVFATALYRLTGTRPVDQNWEKRRRDVQQ